jgi:hypothetical protein
MAKFIRIGDEIINLDNVLRIERGTDEGTRPRVVVFFAGSGEQQTQYTDAQAAAIWERFAAMAQKWDVPEAVHNAPAGAGRTERAT